MRVDVSLLPESLGLPPGRKMALPRKASDPVPRCVGRWCKNPEAGARSKGGNAPIRVNGYCRRCWGLEQTDRRRRSRGQKPIDRGVARCIDPNCPDPFGGPKRKDRPRPHRLRGFCRTCWNRYQQRHRRAQAKREAG